MQTIMRERSSDFALLGNDVGFISCEAVDGQVVIDAIRSLDVKLTPAKARCLANQIHRLADRASQYVPLPEADVSITITKGNKFVAVNRKTNRKALAGGACTCLKVSAEGPYIIVDGVDACGAERSFSSRSWRFALRS